MTRYLLTVLVLSFIGGASAFTIWHIDPSTIDPLRFLAGAAIASICLTIPNRP